MAKQEVFLGDTGSQLVSKLKNNFDELYLGSGGIGYIIQATDDISDNAWWTTMAATYKTFSIIRDFDFGGATVTLPADIVLLFNGGVWSNGTITGLNTSFASYGLQQCFETNLTLDGRWILEYITPQHYGAVTNANSGVFANDSSAAIQKCVDSLFMVYIPAGFYYISSPIYLTQKTTVICDQRIGYYSAVAVTTPDHTRIYTDQDIDMIVFRASAVRWLGGLVECTLATVYTHAAVMFDMDYQLSLCEVKMIIYGSRTRLRAGETQSKGFYLSGDIATAGNGFMMYARLDLIIAYFSTGIDFADSIPPLPIYYNFNRLNAQISGCKRCMNIETADYCEFDGHLQADYVCSIAEMPIAAANFGSDTENNYIKVTGSDFIDAPYFGFYTNSKIIENNGRSNVFYLEGLTTPRGFNVFKTDPLTNANLSFPTDLLVLNNYAYTGYYAAPFISPIHNMFAYLFKRNPNATLVLYDGTGYDFDANLTPSIGLPAAVSLAESIIVAGVDSTDFRGNKPRYYWNDLTGVDTDFIEIYIPFSVAASPYALGIYLFEGWLLQRIQVIATLTDLSTLVENIYPPELSNSGFHKYYKLFEDGVLIGGIAVDSLIIRLIGGENIVIDPNSFIVISDLTGRSRYTSDTSMIDIGGGQTIYGTLALTDALIQTELSGALTDGAPTDAEIDSITGTTPAAAGAGWKCTIKDTSGTGLIYLVESDGTDWFYTVMTKAV